jgi:hypothetical protein
MNSAVDGMTRKKNAASGKRTSTGMRCTAKRKKTSSAARRRNTVCGRTTDGTSSSAGKRKIAPTGKSRKIEVPKAQWEDSALTITILIALVGRFRNA